MPKHTILIIEDDQALGEVLKHRLEQEGHTIYWERDGMAGFNVLKTKKPELLITDISLPTISGIEILVEKKKDPAISEIPVLILSNSFMPKNNRQMDDLGVCAFLVKAQLTPSDILATIQTIMDTQQTDGELPKGDVQADNSTPISSGIPKPTEALITDIKGKVILLVEDDSFLHSIVSKRFENEGVTMVHAVTGEEAIKAIGENHIDLMILDVLLPGMNGFEVLAEVRKNPATQEIPVVVVSNFSQQEDMDKARECGAHYLVKALVSPDDIVTKIKEVFAGALA